MLLQGTGNAERHVTQPALHGFFPGATVCFHVAGKLAGLCTTVRTQLALVRLLTSVRAPVNGKIRTVLEHFAAELAGVVAAVARHDVFAEFRVEQRVNPALLHKGFDGAGLHRG